MERIEKEFDRVKSTLKVEMEQKTKTINQLYDENREVEKQK